jgi:hypothetical protein
MADYEDGGPPWEAAIDRRTLLKRGAVAGGVLATAGMWSRDAWGSLPEAAGNVTFYSTQLAQVQESEAFRNVLLAGFDGKVDSVFAASEAEFDNRVRAEARANKGTIDVLGALHGSFSTLEDKNYLSTSPTSRSPSRPAGARSPRT